MSETHLLSHPGATARATSYNAPSSHPITLEYHNNCGKGSLLIILHHVILTVDCITWISTAQGLLVNQQANA